MSNVTVRLSNSSVGGLRAVGSPNVDSATTTDANGRCKRVVHTLLEAGANAAASVTTTAATPLHVAAMKGHADAVQALLAAGCRPARVAGLGVCNATNTAVAAAWRALARAGETQRVAVRSSCRCAPLRRRRRRCRR